MIDYHRGLLLDESRTNLYRAAIHRLVKPDDVVIDLGCGTGILSFFACEAGAAKVYAIEQNHLADVARLLVKRSGLEGRIEVIHDESSVVALPERADVLITETIGAFGFDEQILSAVVDARARLLNPAARILPQQLVLSAAPVEVTSDYESSIAFWNARRYGVDFSPLQMLASNTPQHLHMSEEAHLAEGIDMLRVDLSTTDAATVKGQVRFVARRDAVVHGFAVWFTATLVEGITLTNRFERATHWSQGFFPLEHPIPASRGTHIALHLETSDGRFWGWRGSVGETEFDQHSGFAMPPCSLARRAERHD